MATRHVEEVFDTLANFHSDADVKQFGFETTSYRPLWKRESDTVRTYIGAVQGYSTDGSTFAAYADNHFNNLTVHDDLYIADRVYHYTNGNNFIVTSGGVWDFYLNVHKHLGMSEDEFVSIDEGGNNITLVLGGGSGKYTGGSQLALYTDSDTSSGCTAESWQESSSPASGDTIYAHRHFGENDADEKTEYARTWVTPTNVGNGTEEANYRIGVIDQGDGTPTTSATYLNVGPQRYIGAETGLEYVGYELTPHVSLVQRQAGGIGTGDVGGFYAGGNDDANNEVTFCDAIVVSVDDTENYVDARWEFRFSDDSVIDGNQLEVGHTTQTDIGAVLQVTDALPVIGTASNYDHGDTANVGKLVFYGHDSASADQLYASINAECVEDLAGSEEGLMEFRVADPDNSGNQTTFVSVDGSDGWLHDTAFIAGGKTAVGAGGSSGSPTQQTAKKKIYFTINPGSAGNDYFQFTNGTDGQPLFVNNISGNTGYLWQDSTPTWKTIGPNDWAIGFYCSDDSAWKWIVGTYT